MWTPCAELVQSSKLVLPIHRQQCLQPVQGEGALAGRPVGNALARTVDPDVDRKVEAECRVGLGGLGLGLGLGSGLGLGFGLGLGIARLKPSVASASEKTLGLG